MFKTKIIPIFFILFIILFALVFRGLIEDENVLKTEFSKGKLIAACPTSYKKYKNAIPYSYKIIPTRSTAESMELMKRGQADFVLSGRTQKADEQAEKGFVLEKGYSFLSDQELFISQSELSSHNIFTDQDVELIKDLFSLEQIEVVPDVYEFLKQGIVITSWDNVDYERAELVHVFNSNGERLPKSRQHTLYCLAFCEDGLFEELLPFLLADQAK